MRAYLTSSEIALIKGDWAALLNSPEASVVTFEYSVGSGQDDDNAFNVSDYDSVETQSFTGKVIQQIVKPRDEELLKWGIVEIGDSIFYTSIDYNLSPSGAIQGSLEIIDGEGLRHTPVPRIQGAFYKYLITRLGSTQIAQVVPCKVKK